MAAFSDKNRPEDLTPADLEAVAEFMANEYVSGALTPYLSCVFTMNSVYLQPSWDRERRLREARDLLYSFREPSSPEAAGLRCVFSGEPATRIAYRQHVPMLTGEGVLNFFPAGIGGLPVSGRYLLAIQAFPLGARRCHGRALGVHSVDDPELTYAFARHFLAENRRLLLLAQAGSGEKFMDAKAPRTLVVDSLLRIEDERRQQAREGPAPSVTVYHLTNSGQGPDIDVLQLPSQVVSFLREAARAETHHVWNRIQWAAWERVRSATRRARDGQPRAVAEDNGSRVAAEAGAWGPGLSRNYLYEDLFSLPGNAAHFVRTYFLRRAYRFGRENDPRRDYRLSEELDLVSWELTRLLLREVVGVEKVRVETIRNVADRIAEHVAADNDRRLFQGLYRVRRYGDLRNLLIKASGARLKKGEPPLVGFEEFLWVFEEGGDSFRTDWALARDLLLIRVIEQLHGRGWFGRAPEVLDVLAEEEQTETA